MSSEFKPFLALSIIVTLGIGFMWVFNYNRIIQVQIAIMLGVLYVIWGIVYHAMRKDLHFRIVLEYVAIALLACLFTVSILLRS